MSQVKDYIEKLSEFIPVFSEHWQSEDATYNFGTHSSVHGVFSEFSLLVAQRLESQTLENAQEIFSFIEVVVAEGGNPADAACTCFLENILNRTPEDIDPETFVPYLGTRSKEFCRAWDDFTGVKTPGL